VSRIQVALIGIGKIARDQHVPALVRSDAFELTAAVTRHTPPQGVPAFATIAEMKQALPAVSAASLCTPPRGRLEIIREAFRHGLDLMIEKPPAATISEARQIVELAAEARRVLFVSWHARAAAAVEPARAWLAGKTIRRVHVCWKEDVRVWHPGQRWIWEPGIGVFDPGVNALSILTRILPGPLVVRDATLEFPVNKAAPMAAALRLSFPDEVPVSVDLDFDQQGPQTWDIDVDTDQGRLKLSMGGARMTIDGRPAEFDADAEYRRLYKRFARLLERRESDTDLSPFELVADCFLLGRRRTGPAFEDF
jgi:D-galactose 1-dehydrogenase